MLAARRLNQPVKRIVDIVGRGIDLLIGVESGFQRRVRNPRDVADWVIDIAEILHRRGIVENLRREPVEAGRPRGFEIRKPKRFGIVGVGRRGAIAVVDQRALPLGVIGDISDESCPGRLSIGERAAQIDVHPLQQARFAERRAIDTAVRRRGRNRAIERVIGGGAGKRLGFQGRRLRPIRLVLVVARELAAASQRIALEVVEVGNPTSPTEGVG
jgi:hypothetical protein